MRIQWRKIASRRRKLLITLGVIVVVLIGARIYLPFGLQRYVNHKLDEIPEYDGHIGDIDVHLWRGAYTIEDIRLIKTTGNVPVPLFASPRVDLAIQWDALMAGEVVGRILMERPELNFVDSDEKGEDQTGAGGP